MEIIKNFVTWFNGKKTIIGLIGTNILQMNELNFVANMNTDLHAILLYVFGALAAGGLLHKGVKSVKK